MTRLHVDDAALAVVAALDWPAVAAGEVFNVGEAATYSVRARMEVIMSEAGRATELVRVPDDALPPDLRATRAHSQHLLTRSTDTDADFSLDDQALAGASAALGLS
jgi:nucleoside-diphosphate-sugar epimerase